MGFITDLLAPLTAPRGARDRHAVQVEDSHPILDQRRAAAADRRRPIGQFRDLEPAPQEPTRAIVGEFLDSLMDQPGIRLAQPTGRRVFFGGGMQSPQRFTTGPHPVNQDANIRAGVIAANTSRTITRSKVGVVTWARGRRG